MKTIQRRGSLRPPSSRSVLNGTDHLTDPADHRTDLGDHDTHKSDNLRSVNGGA
jgi:hypothetical protein